MIAHIPSHRLPHAASPITPESLLAPDARLREIARLLALGALRALWAHTPAHVANVGSPASCTRRRPLSNPVDLAPEVERACAHARAPGVARMRLADASTESEP